MEDKSNINENNQTNNVSNNIQKNKTKKKHRFLKFLLIVLIILVGIKIFNVAKKYHKQRKFDKSIKESVLVDPIKEIELTKEELNQDSNGDGLTNEEKIQMGLDILLDDTDGDGLTDYDEINIYKSDPTRFSTSGDVLSDAEKVQKGYDINKFYNDSRQIETGNSNVLLTADEAIDIQAYYKEYTGTVPGKYYLGMQPFRVYSFTGKVEVKIENPKYYEVISYDNIKREETKVKYKTTDDTIIFNISNDNPILIVYKQSVLKKLEQNAMSNLEFNVKENAEYIMIEFPLASAIIGVPTYIFEVNDSILKNTSNTILEEEVNAKLEGSTKVKVPYINSLGKKIIEIFFGKFKNRMNTYFENEEIDKSIIDYIFIYNHFYDKTSLENYLYGEQIDNEETSIDKTDNEETEEKEITYEFENKYKNTTGEYYADSGFSVTQNAFKFKNLQTKVSEGGVCMGFAHITTNMYNNGNLNPKIKDKYDLSSNDYTSIWNKQLYFYNPTSELATYADDIYKNEPVLDSSTMDKPDSEVVKVLEYYFEKINGDIRTEKFSWAWNSSVMSKKTRIKEETINKLVSKFKNGEIASACLLGNGQHAINVYKIVEDVNDPDILYLKAYDNNFPADMYWNVDRDGKVKYDVTITLKRCYRNTIFGVEKYYLYDYNPLNNDNYHYNSIDNGTDFILFLDENGNIVN